MRKAKLIPREIVRFVLSPAGLCAFICAWLGFAVMPDGPWYRETAAGLCFVVSANAFWWWG